MNEQPEALRLADLQDAGYFKEWRNTSNELRRLYAENEMFRVMHKSHADKLKAVGAINAQLLEALEGLKTRFPTSAELHAAGWDQADIDEAHTAYDEARSAIAAANKEKNI